MSPAVRSAGGTLAVVGGGLVGLATARVAAGSGHQVVVLEAEQEVARHQSGRNSGVIHSGVYYEPGSEKARLCTRGRTLLFEYCRDNGIETRRCGKLIVAVEPRDLRRLDELEARGRANGLEGIARLGRDQIRDREPAVVGAAGLWVPQTGVVDFREVARALAREIRSLGGEVRTEARVVALRQSAGRVAVETTSGALECRWVVNCAGLESDRVARMAGAVDDLLIVPFRGEYRAIVGPRKELVRGLVYPVPDPALPFLGVHCTRTIDGRVLVGPNAVPAGSRYGYQKRMIDWRDVWETVSFPGTWRLGLRLWRLGAGELRRSCSDAAFLEAVRRLLPDLEAADLASAPSGVRAQAVDRAGRLVDDFRFARHGRVLSVLNAPSPAATAALAIGERIVQSLDS